MKSKYSVCSLFAGIGGIDKAFENAGFKIKWANEIDKYACRTYRLNFVCTTLVEGDIRLIDASDIPDCNVLIAGFPCQAFSSVGLKQGFDDERGNVFFEIIRVLKKMKPECIFFENVSNLVKHDSGKTFEVIKSLLEELGYNITYKIMNASDYGIPQQRNRIYIVGFLDKKKAESFKFPETMTLKNDAFSYLNKNKVDDKYYMNHLKDFTEIAKVVIDRKRIYRFTDWGISTGREGICPTLLAAMGSQFPRIPFIRDDYGVRKLTQRECANLQGFSDDFKFDYRTPKQVYKQIGNSVCVPIVQMIAKRIKLAMKGV